MASNEERPRSPFRDPQAASGGHLAPETRPLETVASSQPASVQRERTDVVPRGLPTSAATTPRRTPTNGDAPRRSRPAVRRVQRTLAHVDLLSVLKLSLFYYGVLFLLWLGFVAVVYSILETLGVFRQIESALANPGVLGLELDITLGEVEQWAGLIGATLVVIGSLANVFLAFVYNMGSTLLGGLEMTFVERDR